MYLYWLCYHHEARVHVVIQRGSSLISARLATALAKLDLGTFAEGHELDAEMAKLVPRAMIGRRFTSSEAARLLKSFAGAKSVPRSKSKIL